MLSFSSDTFVVTLAGMPATGKSTIARLLERSFGFNWIRTRQIVQDLGADGSIESLQRHGSSLATGDGAKLFCDALFSRILSGRCNVVDAVRPLSHWHAIRSNFGERAALIGVHASADARSAWLAARHSSLTLQARDDHDVERDVPALLQQAAYVLVNGDLLDYRVELMLSFLFRETLPPPITTLRNAQTLGVELSRLRTVASPAAHDPSGIEIATIIARLQCQ